MQIQLNKVLQIYSFCNKIKEEKMSLALAYKFAQLSDSLESQVSFYQDRYNRILDTYAEKDEYGQFIQKDENSIQLKKGATENCAKEISELDSMQVSIENIEFEFEQLEELSLTPSDVQILLPFIKK